MTYRYRPVRIDKDTMDHDEAREQLELAAVEPGGLDRMLAGDTAVAQAVAGHLAGCPSCTDEFVRLQRASSLIGSTVREMPAADLRERTFAAIRAEGVARPIATGSAQPGTVVVAVAPSDRAGRRRQAIGWIGTMAAAVVLSVVTTSFVVNTRVDDELAAQALTIAALEQVTYSTMHVTAEPDAEQVILAGVSDPALAGSLVYSPSTTELVVVADGLVPPAAGQEYRCWIEVDGIRKRVGRMFFGDDLAYWSGPAPAVSGVAGAATFGVSLVDASGSSIDTAPVLVGQL
jgi:hypothetical protein